MLMDVFATAWGHLAHAKRVLFCTIEQAEKRRTSSIRDFWLPWCNNEVALILNEHADGPGASEHPLLLLDIASCARSGARTEAPVGAQMLNLISFMQCGRRWTLASAVMAANRLNRGVRASLHYR